MTVLDRILDDVRERLAARRREDPFAAVRRRAESVPPPPSFADAIAREGTSLIAEAKQRSPSRPQGIVPAAAFDPAGLARTYEQAGARAMSVLTEPTFFGGSPEHLRAARAACALPLLRKDFVVDGSQVWEAREWGASAVLLIVAALDDALLADLLSETSEAGLDALVEVHTLEEAERALAHPVRILGVNNRDLRTFVTDRATTARVAERVPAGTLLVSESGISTREHVEEVEAAGARAVLVGEGLLASGDPGAKARELIGETARS